MIYAECLRSLQRDFPLESITVFADSLQTEEVFVETDKGNVKSTSL